MHLSSQVVPSEVFAEAAEVSAAVGVEADSFLHKGGEVGGEQAVTT